MIFQEVKMKSERLIKTCIFLVLIVFIGFGIIFCFSSKDDIYTHEGISLISKTEGRLFKVYKNGKFHDVFLKGVNIGATQPGSFPGELAISKETYLSWFQQIHDMNSDVIRVYTTMMPHFYEALYEFNKTVKNPLYLLQGVWINEYVARDLGDAFGNQRELLNTFIKDTTDLIDIIHGNAVLEHQYGFAYGNYTFDVSPYVIGWILGVEWDPLFVLGTNMNNEDLEPYEGNYIYSHHLASPFEIFLTEVGDKIIEYEVETYKFMRPVSFTNWLTTDHLIHPNEPDEKEDLVSVNTEHIIAKDAFFSGLFASYHVYPYYPEFMNYSNEYTNHIDHRGEKNPYQGYLVDLFNHLTVPVLVAEFGIPASRGKTHDAINSGFNQGFISEVEQGEMILHMLEDIYEAQYFGALVFAWQDEWFKRTWNTMDFDLPLRRPHWSNIQTNEQHFGLMAFDPGVNQRIRYVDGNPTDWLDQEPLFENNELSLYVAFDARYVYIYIQSDTYNFEHDQLYIPIMTNRDQGNNGIKDTQIRFSHSVDFLIEINGIQKSEIKIDPYYDPFYYLYHELLNLMPLNPLYNQKNSGLFVSMYQALSAEIYLPEDNRTIPFSKHHTGKLIYGNANPNHPDYYSLADFFFNEGHLEIKIPWQLLNISDPSSKMMLSDLYSNPGFSHEIIDGLFIGAQIISQDQESHFIELFATTWEAWEMPVYHERLKQSYYIVKLGFKKYP
jgi:hypothetical protein